MSDYPGKKRIIICKKFVEDCCSLSNIPPHVFWSKSITYGRRFSVMHRLYSSIELLPSPVMTNTRWWYISDEEYTHYILRYS